MDTNERKKHWEKVYATKKLEEVGWYQPTPKTSLDLIGSSNVPLDAKIIDIGGGDSLLVDHLLDRGYRNITVLDISETSLEKAKKRLGVRAEQVKWIVADVTKFKPTETYDIWHDRAAFHFLLEDAEVVSYLHSALLGIVPNGLMILGTFSDQGPKKCSGLDVKQYGEIELTQVVNKDFQKIKCLKMDHKTPSGNLQNFLFCLFRRK